MQVKCYKKENVKPEFFLFSDQNFWKYVWFFSCFLNHIWVNYTHILVVAHIQGKASNFLQHWTVSQSKKLPTNIRNNKWNTFPWQMPVIRLRQLRLGSCFSWRSLDRLSGNEKYKWTEKTLLGYWKLSNGNIILSLLL